MYLHFYKLQGIGDSGQGAANAIIFVLFTRQVRKNMASWVRSHCCCYSTKKRQMAEVAWDRSDADDDVAGCNVDDLGHLLQKKQLTATGTDVETPNQFSNTVEEL